MPGHSVLLLVCFVFIRGIELSEAENHADTIVGSLNTSGAALQTETPGFGVTSYQEESYQNFDLSERERYYGRDASKVPEYSTSATTLNPQGDTASLEQTSFAVRRKCQHPGELSLSGKNCTVNKKARKGLRQEVDASVVFYRTVGGWITLSLLIVGILFLFLTHFASISSFNNSGALNQPFCSFPSNAPDLV